MKITVTEDIWEDGYEGCLTTKIETGEGSKSVSFGSGEPEDMNLIRDLSDAYSIKHMLVMAYHAGINNEDLEVIKQEVN